MPYAGKIGEYYARSGFSNPVNQARAYSAQTALKTSTPAIMDAATRRQRTRAASNTGEQALLVLRKNGWIDTLFDARSEAVCRSAVEMVTALLWRIAIDETAATRRRHRYRAAAVVRHGRLLRLVLQAARLRRSSIMRRRARATVLTCSSEPVSCRPRSGPTAAPCPWRWRALDIEKLSAFGLARSCAEALEALTTGLVQRDPGPDDAFRTSRVPVGADACGDAHGARRRKCSQ